jgi:hypothetical protein
MSAPDVTRRGLCAGVALVAAAGGALAAAIAEHSADAALIAAAREYPVLEAEITRRSDDNEKAHPPGGGKDYWETWKELTDELCVRQAAIRDLVAATPARTRDGLCAKAVIIGMWLTVILDDEAAAMVTSLVRDLQGEA